MSSTFVVQDAFRREEMAALDASCGKLSEMPQRTPIGIFDSGLGGLSVLGELLRVMPDSSFVYVADSLHVPYGTKPPDFIRARSLAITHFLLDRHRVGTVVVGCNTATTHAVASLRERFASIPFVGMEPALKPAAAATRSGIVGVLATPATLSGDRFMDLAERYTDGIELLTQPSPGLVEQVERGDLDGPETERLLQLYTEPMLARGADTIVLGCTHYPFLRETLQRIVGPAVTLIDTGAAVARQTARVVRCEAPVSGVGTQDDAGQITYYSSGDVTSAATVAASLLRRRVECVLPLPI
jgi:glutamate racemase